VMARSSLMESQNQLRTAVDKGHITEATRLEHDELAEAALEQTTGLMEYLQSPEALRKAREARERRDEKRAARKLRTPKVEPNKEPNPESNPEPNPEPRTEPGTEPRTRTENREPRTENDG
jgi:hypothetical protein